MSEEKADQGTVQIALRISPSLRERIKAAADANHRSVNGELTAALEYAYPAPRAQSAAADAVSKMLDGIIGLPSDEWDDVIARVATEYGLNPRHFTATDDERFLSVNYEPEIGRRRGAHMTKRGVLPEKYNKKK